MTSANVLVLSADPLLEAVVRHLLPAERYGVWRTQNLEELAGMIEQGGRLAVLDLPEVDAPTLAFIRQLHAEGGKPLLVLTDHPEQLADQLEAAVRLLHRPPPLNQLQAALNAALAEPGPPPGDLPPGAAPASGGWATARRRLVGLLGLAALAALALLLIGSTLGLPGVPNVLQWAVGKKEEAHTPPPPPVTLLAGQADAFEVPADVINRMNVPRKPFKVQASARPRTLTLSGTLAFDPDRLARIQSRFPGEVVGLGTADGKPIDEARQSPLSPLQYGNPVKRNQPLAIVWSKDLGEKKSELADGLSQLNLDRETLKKLQELDTIGGTSQAVLRQAQRNVTSSLNAVNRAERTLRTWKVSEEEIDAVKEEAKRIIDRKGKRDAEREKGWARVEIHSPIDGVVVEKNVVRGNIVDSTQDLFKIADLSALAVYVHVYEEDQRDLEGLKKAARDGLVPWRLHLTSDPDKRPLTSPGIKRLGLIIDPNQHTNMAMGVVENPNRQLRAGQFVTAEVDMPPPADVLSVPAAALEEDGNTSHVLLQLEPGRYRYALRRVRVVRRFLDFAYVCSKLSDSDRAAGLYELKPGDLVVTGKTVQLKAAFEDAQARARAHK